MLRTKLKPPIRSKCHGKLRKDVILQQDNAQPHSAKRTAKTIKKLGFELLEHPLHSPNLAPRDVYTFGPLKEALGGRRFAIDAEVMMLCKTGYRCNQKKLFFSDGIKKLVKRCTKCLEVQAGNVENIMYASVFYH